MDFLLIAKFWARELFFVHPLLTIQVTLYVRTYIICTQLITPLLDLGISDFISSKASDFKILCLT